jgi:signal transduction histidine kinase
VVDLSERIGGQALLPSPVGPAPVHVESDLDLRSVIQASQALTSALSFDELLQVIMRITALTASATRALVVLDSGAQGLTIAGASVSQGPTPRIAEPRLDRTREAPAAPIRLAYRTLREISIDDPEYANLRSQDPYLARLQPRSALCVPLVYGARAHGVLYLENQVAAGVYNTGRREAIRLLATQIAISLEHTQLYSNLELARAAAEAANQAKSSFLANMSHELRTPLTAILGYAELIVEESTDRGELASIPDLERIHRSGVHLLEVIGDILDLSKIEADKFELVVEEFDIAPLLQTVVEAVEPTVLAGGNTLVFTPPAGLGRIRSDRLRLRQILLNLLSNAGKFTENGTVTMTVARAGGRLRVSVRDTGIGMSARQLDRVFDAFHQADATATRKVGGTGLGLTISRRLAQLLGGDITAVSAPGEGSRFTLDLPLDLAPGPEAGDRRSLSP